jgi:hypothetical protein
MDVYQDVQGGGLIRLRMFLAGDGSEWEKPA